MNRFVLVLCFFVQVVAGQTKLERAVLNLANDSSLKYGSLGVSVIDVETGQQLASLIPNQALKPASSLKIVTTSVALAVLGPDFRFKTDLEYDGEIDESGILHGNIYIKGYGDPTLGSDHFEAAENLEKLMHLFVEVFQKKGIKKVEGYIIGDGSYFETAVNGRTWLWEDLGNYYASGAWGLNIHENRYFISFQQSSKLGAIPEIVAVFPKIPNLLLLNEVTSAAAGSGDNAYIFGSPFSYTRFIRGTIPVGTKLFTIKGAIPDPPFFAANCLLNALSGSGIVTTKTATSLFELERTGIGKSFENRTTLYTHQSPTLKEIVKETNLKSVNLYCESMLKLVGNEFGQERSSAAGLAAINKFWSDRGLNMDGFFMEDGSGLSPLNAVSTFHLASIMRKIAKDNTLFPDFYASLPVAGRSGTLSSMFKGSPANGVLRAKSGGMSRVRSYTGYATTKSGRLLAFSIIANNFTGKSNVIQNKMAKVMEAMCLLP